MYIAPPDQTTVDDEWRDLVATHAFGYLVAAGRDRHLPESTPTQFVLDGDGVILHVVSRNPMLDAIAEKSSVMLCVAGDWTFIPSDWKAPASEGEDPALGIPTTSYAAVELIGTATVVEGPDPLAALLRRQLDRTQPGVPIADPGQVHRARLQAIRGIHIAMRQPRSKFQFGGNVDPIHHLRIAELLDTRNGPGDTAAAAHLLRRYQLNSEVLSR